MIGTATAPALQRRNITLAIAAVLALGTGWLTFSYLNTVNRSSTVASRLIIVAARDIPARTTITPDMLGQARRPANAIDPDTVVLSTNAVGSIARVTIPAGSALTASKLARKLDAGLIARIHPGMRAIAIPIDRVKGVANLMQPGDHVDVIALTRPAPGVAPKALAILRDKIVLAVGTTYETLAAGNATPSPEMTSTATLEVTPKEAAELALADANTTLRLALRVPNEPARSQSVDPLVLEAAAAPHLAAAPVAAPAAAPPAPRAIQPPAAPKTVHVAPPPVSTLTVIQGDRVTAVSRQ